MQRGRFIFAAALALTTVSAQAAIVSSTDFTLQDATRAPTKWEFNNNVGLSFNRLGTSPVVDLGLADNKGSQYGIAWTNDTFKLDSFSMYADIIVDFHPRGPGVSADCPADGFALAFGAPTDQFQVGGGGGSLGLYSNGDGIPQFIALEVNTWYGQALRIRTRALRTTT